MTKIFKFRLTSNEVKKFHRNIEIKSSVNFFDFHDAIQSEVGFDKSQLTSFFLTDEKGLKKQEICLFDIPVEGVLVMDETILSSQLKKIGQKLIYKFDFKLNRLFNIELIEILDEDRFTLYPICSSHQGNSPSQVIYKKEEEVCEDVLEEIKDIDKIKISDNSKEDDSEGEDFGIDDDFLNSLDNFDNENKYIN